MGFLDFLQSVASGQTQTNPLLQRVAQQVTDAQHPTLAGHDVSGIPVLSGVLRPAIEAANYTGLLNEGAGQVARGLTGAGTAALGGLHAAMQGPGGSLVNALAQTNPATAALANALTFADKAGPHLGPANPLPGLAAALGGAQAGGNPLERAMAAGGAAQQVAPVQTSLGEMALNPLNFAAPAAEAGRGLQASRDAVDALGSYMVRNPTALERTLGTALEAAGGTGQVAMLPYQAGFGALGGLFKGAKNAIAPAAKAAIPELAAAADSGTAALPAALAPSAPSAPAFGKATLAAIAKSGIDPAKLAGLDDDLARYVAENAGAGQEDGLIAALRGAAPAEAAPAATAPTAALQALETPTPTEATPALSDLPGASAGTPDAPVTEAVAALDTPAATAPAADLTARQDALDMFGQMDSGDKARMLHDLLTANYGDQGGSVAALRNIYGRAFVGDKEIGAAFDHLIQRTSENPEALAALGEINAPLAHGIPTIAPSPQSATELQNAIRQGLGQPAKKGTQFAGDIAAGGGGMGIVAPRLGQTLAGATGGGLLGAGIGAATDSQDRLRGAGGGALLGASLGGSLGAATPDLLPGLRTNLLDPLAAVAREGAAAQRQAIATGEKNPLPSFSKALPYIRSIKKTSAMTLPRNVAGALTTTAIGEGNVPEAAANMRDIWRNLPTLLPALRAAGNDAAARDQALLSALPPRMQAFDAAGMRDLIEQAGVNYERNPTDLGAANVHPLAGAMRGAGLAIATPKTLVMGPASLALGALEGATLPGRAAMQTAMLTPIDQGARMAFAFPEYARTLAEAAPAFLRKVAATGQDVAALGADGAFGAADIADPTLAAEWRGIQQAAAKTGGALAKDRLGDFSKPGVATNFVNNFFPGGSWNVEQAKVLAKAAARHPAQAIGLLGLIEQDYQRHLQGGDPQHAGTWRLTDQTPGFGALVRLANGGAAGDLYLNPAYPISPVGGEVLNLPRELSPQLNPGMKIYDQGATIAGALGLGINPEIGSLAYKAGQSDSAPSSQVRLAPVGAFADAMLHRAGAPLWDNPLGQAMMPDAEQTPDLRQQIQFNRFLDPAAIRAGNEMIYERTGKSSSDPANEPLVAQLRDPNSDFYKAALVRGLGGKAATAVTGNVVPGSPQAETATAHAGAAAKMDLLQQGLPITREQLQAIAARPDGGQILSQLRQAQIDAAKIQNPVLAVQDVGTAKDLGAKVFQQWQRENGGLAGFPIVYNILAQREQERLGLVPLGTAMGQQTAYDQLNAGQAYGRPQPYPGVQPLPFDPQPMYDLYRLFGGGR